MKIGVMELVVIFIVALLVIGPDKLPLYAKKLGGALRDFRKASADMTKEIRENVVDPLEEAQKPLREAMEPLEDLNRDLNENLKSVEKGLNGIGKTKKEVKKADAPAAAEKAAHTESPADAAPTRESTRCSFSGRTRSWRSATAR